MWKREASLTDPGRLSRAVYISSHTCVAFWLLTTAFLQVIPVCTGVICEKSWVWASGTAVTVEIISTRVTSVWTND